MSFWPSNVFVHVTSSSDCSVLYHFGLRAFLSNITWTKVSVLFTKASLLFDLMSFRSLNFSTFGHFTKYHFEFYTFRSNIIATFSKLRDKSLLLSKFRFYVISAFRLFGPISIRFLTFRPMSLRPYYFQLSCYRKKCVLYSQVKSSGEIFKFEMFNGIIRSYWKYASYRYNRDII